MSSAIAIAKVTLAILIHTQFQFLSCCSSWLGALLIQPTSHASSLLSTQSGILDFLVNHILQVACDWILCYEWYALHSAGWQTALWPCHTLVWNGVWPCETSLHPANNCSLKDSTVNNNNSSLFTSDSPSIPLILHLFILYSLQLHCSSTSSITQPPPTPPMQTTDRGALQDTSTSFHLYDFSTT